MLAKLYLGLVLHYFLGNYFRSEHFNVETARSISTAYFVAAGRVHLSEPIYQCLCKFTGYNVAFRDTIKLPVNRTLHTTLADFYSLPAA